MKDRETKENGLLQKLRDALDDRREHRQQMKFQSERRRDLRRMRAEIDEYGVLTHCELMPDQTELDLRGVGGIGPGVFEGCTQLRRILAWPSSFRTVGERAFAGCSALTEIEIEESSFDDGESGLVLAGSIGASAFAGCGCLRSLQLPAYQEIGEMAFAGCASLEKLTLAALPLEYEKQDYIFDETVRTVSGEFTEGKGIGKQAFSGCEALKELVIPGQFHTIGEEAWKGCDLHRLQLESGVGVIHAELPAQEIVMPDTLISTIPWSISRRSSLLFAMPDGYICRSVPFNWEPPSQGGYMPQKTWVVPGDFEAERRKERSDANSRIAAPEVLRYRLMAARGAPPQLRERMYLENRVSFEPIGRFIWFVNAWSAEERAYIFRTGHTYFKDAAAIYMAAHCPEDPCYREYLREHAQRIKEESRACLTGMRDVQALEQLGF